MKLVDCFCFYHVAGGSGDYDGRSSVFSIGALVFKKYLNWCVVSSDRICSFVLEKSENHFREGCRVIYTDLQNCANTIDSSRTIKSA